MLELQYDFEELNIPVCGKNAAGLMIYGTATLEGDDDGFCVTAIRLEGGTWLRPKGNGGFGFSAPFEDELFHRIAGVIENPKTPIGKHASGQWDDLRERRKSGDSDRRYDERRDHEAMGWV